MEPRVLVLNGKQVRFSGREKETNVIHLIKDDSKGKVSLVLDERLEKSSIKSLHKFLHKRPQNHVHVYMCQGVVPCPIGCLYFGRRSSAGNETTNTAGQQWISCVPLKETDLANIKSAIIVRQPSTVWPVRVIRKDKALAPISWHSSWRNQGEASGFDCIWHPGSPLCFETDWAAEGTPTPRALFWNWLHLTLPAARPIRLGQPIAHPLAMCKVDFVDVQWSHKGHYIEDVRTVAKAGSYSQLTGLKCFRCPIMNRRSH